MNLPDCIRLEETPAGYPICVISHASATARVALNGAHVMEWTPAGHSPVLYLSPDAILAEGKAIRGGIPICWPWFNAHPTDASKPMHGIARNRPWTLVRADEKTDHVTLLFKLESDEATQELWPQDFRCYLGISIGAALEVTLMTENTGSESFSVAEALHTYLTVGDIKQISIVGLHDTPYLDTVGERTLRHQTGDVTFEGEVDRQYHSTAGVVIHDPALSRKLIVDKLGSSTTVVWNPWIEKSKRLADLPDEAFHNFLCVEAANAGDATVTVQPGGSHAISTRVTVSA